MKNRRVRILLYIILIICLALTIWFSLSSFRPAQTQSAGTVEQIQGLYIFIKCKPVSQYEYLGTVKGSAWDRDDMESIINTIIRKAKKDYPGCNSLLFDGPLKLNYNTKVSVIRIK